MLGGNQQHQHGRQKEVDEEISEHHV